MFFQRTSPFRFVAFIVLSAVSILSARAADPATYEIETLDNVVIRDPAGPHQLIAKIRMPKAAGSFPVVIFSHSADFTKNLAPDLSSSWASRGYIVIHPTHVEADLVTKEPPHVGNPKIWFNRIRDVKLILDATAKPEAIDERLRGKLDTTRIALSGHSFGAHSSLLLGGATLHHEDSAQKFRDKRVRAVLVVFPLEPDRCGLTAASWPELQVPVMILSGAKPWHKWGFEHCAPGAKYHVAIPGASYFSFVDAKSSFSSPAFMAAAQHASVLFLDAHLKDDKAALGKLSRRDAVIAGGAPAELSIK